MENLNEAENTVILFLQAAGNRVYGCWASGKRNDYRGRLRNKGVPVISFWSVKESGSFLYWVWCKGNALFPSPCGGRGGIYFAGAGEFKNGNRWELSVFCRKGSPYGLGQIFPINTIMFQMKCVMFTTWFFIQIIKRRRNLPKKQED